jgi:hypothetical protein
MIMVLQEFGRIDPAKLPSVLANPKSMVEWLQIRTALTPEMTINRPLESTAGTSNADAFLRLLKPEIRVKLAIDDEPMVIAPFGSPTAGLTRYVGMVAVAGVVGLAVYGALQLLRKKR